VIGGVGVTVGVKVASGVGDWLGVRVQPGGMMGMSGRIEQPAMERASQSLRMRREVFIPFLYWQTTGASSKVVFEMCVIYNRFLQVMPLCGHKSKIKKRKNEHTA
jgi:hypothetical protein